MGKPLSLALSPSDSCEFFLVAWFFTVAVFNYICLQMTLAIFLQSEFAWE